MKKRLRKQQASSSEMVKLKVIDEVLAVFEDGEWHSLVEERQVKLDDFKAALIFEFLAEYGFIEIDKKGMKGRLSPDYQKLRAMKE